MSVMCNGNCFSVVMSNYASLNISTLLPHGYLYDRQKIGCWFVGCWFFFSPLPLSFGIPYPHSVSFFGASPDGRRCRRKHTSVIDEQREGRVRRVLSVVPY